MSHFQFSPQTPKCLGSPVSLSSFLCLNPRHTMLHSWPPSSPSKPSWPELFKLITSNHAPLPKPSQNQITTTTTAKTQPKSNRNKNSEAHQITNQITPTEIKAQNNQNHKMKTLKVNPPLKKHILVLMIPKKVQLQTRS